MICRDMGIHRQGQNTSKLLNEIDPLRASEMLYHTELIY